MYCLSVTLRDNKFRPSGHMDETNIWAMEWFTL